MTDASVRGVGWVGACHVPKTGGHMTYLKSCGVPGNKE